MCIISPLDESNNTEEEFHAVELWAGGVGKGWRGLV